jgi:hypothetical protein
MYMYNESKLCITYVHLYAHEYVYMRSYTVSESSMNNCVVPILISFKFHQY